MRVFGGQNQRILANRLRVTICRILFRQVQTLAQQELDL